jgi:transcriptional regulator with XRE-family HTH domain
MNESFGARLRHERERRKIDLKSIAETTKIGIALLEGLERDDVKRWPSGIFRKAFIKSYALAIGVDHEAVVREFVERFPDPSEVTPAIPETPPADPEQTRSSSRIRFPTRLERIKSLPGRLTAFVRELPPIPPISVKFTIVSTASTFTRGKFIADVRRRWLAAACDVGVSFGMALTLFPVLGHFWTPLGVSMLCYFVGGIVILGNTPGVCLFAPPPRKT